MNEARIVKDEYEAATHKYNKSNSISGLAVMFFMYLPLLLVLIFIDDLFPPTYNLVAGDTTQTCAEHHLWSGIGFGFILLFSSILPITCLVFYNNRLRRNLRLNCPLCDTFIGMENQSIHILKTGMCKQCKEILFEGEFASKEEALQYYHQLEVDDNQTTKSQMKFTSRFAILASILTLIPSLMIYFWTKRINESMGVAGPSIGKFLFPPLIVSLIFGVLSKLILKDCVRRDEELKKEAHEITLLSLKTDNKK